MQNKKHPEGLMVLFFTEMWERFGFYLMLGIFMLYMLASKDTSKPGMGYSLEEATDIYGSYLALVYLTPFIGGLLADRILGYRLSITLGGLFMAAGYFGLSIYNEKIFYISLLLIIIGNGLFKPNISTLVGKLYDNNPQYKSNKDAGFSIFYLGINLGAFICNFVAAYFRNKFGWGWAFASAGIGMLLGLIWFWVGQLKVKNLSEADKISPVHKNDIALSVVFIRLLLPAILASFIGWIIPGSIFGSNSNDAFIFFSAFVVIFYILLYKKAENNEKEQIGALLSVFACVVVFWAIFHQNGAALTIWAEKYTDRKIPQIIENVADKLYLTQIVYNDPNVDPEGSKYFVNLPENKIPENGMIKLFNAELFQSVNPAFIILFTPLIVGFFNFLKQRRRNVSTPEKIGWGMLITAISSLIMVFAVIASKNGIMKVSPWWLISTYAVITIGELCLSPMGLSLVSKLSPQRMTALMMGGWFLSTAIGNKLSGVLSGMWDLYKNKAFFFVTNMILALISVIIIFMLLPWLKKVVSKFE